VKREERGNRREANIGPANSDPCVWSVGSDGSDGTAGWAKETGRCGAVRHVAAYCPERVYELGTGAEGSAAKGGWGKVERGVSGRGAGGV
jgi:hypothetical protein